MAFLPLHFSGASIFTRVNIRYERGDIAPRSGVLDRVLLERANSQRCVRDILSSLLPFMPAFG